MDQIKLTYSNQDEIIIDSVHKFHEILLALTHSDPQIVLVELPHLGILTLGIGPCYGFVEYMAGNGELPYLLAKNEDMPDIAEDVFIEFDAGGTATPIPKNKCLPIMLVIRIAIDIFKNGKIPQYIEWEEE